MKKTAGTGSGTHCFCVYVRGAGGQNGGNRSILKQTTVDNRASEKCRQKKSKLRQKNEDTDI